MIVRLDALSIVISVELKGYVTLVKIDSFTNAPRCDHLTSIKRERSVEIERERSSQSDDDDPKTAHVSSYSIIQP